MSTVLILELVTYAAFAFVLVSYALKVTKILKMPVHLRWELYPVPFGKGHKYGGSYLEEVDWWNKPQPKTVRSSILNMAKRYLFFSGYFKIKRNYWIWVYPWHLGFYLLMGFQAVTLLSALLIVTTGLDISAESSNVCGGILYFLSLGMAIISFIFGAAGSTGLFFNRLVNAALRNYTTNGDYFGYLFFLATFLSGIFMWVSDPTLADFREFWKGLITLHVVDIKPTTFVFSAIFAAHVFHLPFTRSTHYLTKVVSYIGILWDDKAYLAGDATEKIIVSALGQRVTWSAPHIQLGKTWEEIVKELPDSVTGKAPNK